MRKQNHFIDRHNIIDGYEEKLYVTIQKLSKEKIVIVFWEHFYELNANNILQYAYPNGPDDIQNEKYNYFESDDKESFQTPEVTILIREVVQSIFQVALDNALSSIEIVVHAYPQGDFIVDLFEYYTDILSNENEAIKEYVKNTEFRIHNYCDDEEFDGEAHRKRILENAGEYYTEFDENYEVENTEWISDDEKIDEITRKIHLDREYKEDIDKVLEADIKMLLDNTEEDDIRKVVEERSKSKQTPNDNFYKLFYEIRMKKCRENQNLSIELWNKKYVSQDEQMMALLDWEVKRKIPTNITKNLGESGKRLKEVREGISVSNKRALLYYYCFLLNFSKAEMESVFQLAKISLQPQSVGEKIIMNFINRNVYDNDYLMEVFSREPLRELTMREIMGLNE